MEQPKNLAGLLEYHMRLHEGLEPGDIYKLLHQSVFGPEHLGRAASEEAIAVEMQSAGPDREEPFLEPISVGGGACRINLRVARRQGIAPSPVAEAMRRSVERFSGDKDELARLLEEAGDFVKAFWSESGRESFGELARLARERGFPPMHHSQAYRERNRPAYRVLMSDALERLMRPSTDGALWP